MLTQVIKNAIKEHASKSPDEEVCGLILSIGENFLIFKCENISFNKKEHSILNPLDYIKAEKIGNIVGTYHSQKNNEPSLIDNLTSDNHNIFSIVYCWESEKFYLIKPQLISYLYKNFEIGKYDCFTLIKNYYHQQLNISLNDYKREEGWYLNTPKLISDSFNKEGFMIVDKKDRKLHDVLLFGKDFDNLYHMGIFLRNNMFIHHPRNLKSVIEDLGHWESKLILTIRHKSLL